jgi:hypothetical protein
MRRTPFILLALIALVPGVARGQAAPDISGTWNLETDSSLGGDEGGPVCSFAGTALISQQGAELSGSSHLSLVSGGAECPGSMQADLTGEVQGSEIQMGMLFGGGAFGTAEFNGTVGAERGTAGGTFDVQQGPFAGAGGTWSAVRGESVLAIPSLTGVGIALLVALLAVSAAVVLRRRQPAAGR